jgi:ribosomal protein L11 methyltransferase
VDGLSALAQEVLGKAISFSIDAIDPNINWVAKSLEGLKPVKAGGFYIYGSHEEGPLPEGLTAIKIDAAQAFGTGHHETTTGCLEAIDEVLSQKTPERMIDVGTGTGVLAIALAKRLQRPVLASDNDPIAVQTTADNAADNGVADHVVPLEATGLSSDEIMKAAPFDVVVANILAGPLISLAPDMAKATLPGASIILSGILNSQADQVAQAYVAQSMALRRKIEKKEWSTLILERV